MAVFSNSEARKSNGRTRSPELEDVISQKWRSRSRSPSCALEWKTPRDAGLKRLLTAHQPKREKAGVTQRKFAQKLRATLGERSILELNSVKEPTSEKFYDLVCFPCWTSAGSGLTQRCATTPTS